MNNSVQWLGSKILVDDFIIWLNDFEKKHVPFAMSKALNETAFMARSAVMMSMRSFFDRPMPYTVNSLYVKKSTKRDLQAQLFWKAWASKGASAEKYLEHNIRGGSRKPKRSELLLRQAGLIGSDQWLVPANSAPLNAYGNIKHSYVIKMISALQASFDGQQNSTKAAKRNKFFVAGPSMGRKMAGGNLRMHSGKVIMMRRGSGAGDFKPFMFITRPPRYSRIFQFYDIADNAFRRLYKGNFSAALKYALETAK